MRQTLKKNEILRGYNAYKDVLAGAKAYRGKHLKIFILQASGETASGNQPKVGFAVRSVRSAVIRNRMKRLLREVVRRNKELLFRCSKETAATHVLLMCSSSRHHTTGRPDLSYGELENEFRALMYQLSKRQ